MTTDPVAKRLHRIARDIKRYSSRYDPALERFHREMFGPLARQLDRERFRWLFEATPYRDAGPAIWLCIKKGEVVGEQAGIPIRLKIGDAECSASWAMDLMVHPEWRLRGVAPALSECHARHYDVAVALGAPDLLYPAYLRAGWHDLGYVHSYVRPFDLERVLDLRRTGRWATRAARLASPGFRLADYGWHLRSQLSRARLEPIPRFDERVDEVWRASAPAYSVVARRDYRTLRWRFDDAPDARRYHRFYLYRGAELRGYVVLRLGSISDVAVGFVVDYLCPPSASRQLLASCVEWLRRTGVAAAICEMLAPRALRCLLPLGFVPVRRRGAPRFLWKPGGGASVDTSLLDRRGSWFVTRADKDWDHEDPTATN